MEKNTIMLSRGFKVLFWMIIPTMLGGVLTLEQVVEWMPILELPGNILELGCTVLTILVFLHFRRVERRYQAAAICQGILMVVSFLTRLFIPVNGNEHWVFLLAMPVIIIQIIGNYQEYHGHADVLLGVDYDLSEKWRSLFKREMGVAAAVVVGLLIMTTGLFGILGVLVIIAASVVALVLGIQYWVYLFRTMQAFQEEARAVLDDGEASADIPGDQWGLNKKYIAISLALLLGMMVLEMLLLKVNINEVISEQGYMIQNQEKVEITLEIPKASLSDAIYTSEGQTFSENELVVYQTDTTTIYLEQVFLSSGDQLCFMFDHSYDLSDSGVILYPWLKTDNGYSTEGLSLASSALADVTTTYPEALFITGEGPSQKFAISIPVDVCKKAEGTMKIKLQINQISYQEK